MVAGTLPFMAMKMAAEKKEHGGDDVMTEPSPGTPHGSVDP